MNYWTAGIGSGVVALSLAACSFTHNAEEFRQRNQRQSYTLVISESYEELSSRLKDQFYRCFGNKEVTKSSGAEIEQQFYVDYREETTGQRGTLMAGHLESVEQFGIQTALLDSYVAIVDFNAVSTTETQATVYHSPRRSVRRALRMWIDKETNACPRI